MKKSIQNRLISSLIAVALTVVLSISLILATYSFKEESQATSPVNMTAGYSNGENYIGGVGMTSEEYITKQSYIGKSDWAPIDSAETLRSFIKNEGVYAGKNGYLTKSIEDFGWTDKDTFQNLAPKILFEGRTLDGCGNNITVTTGYYVNESEGGWQEVGLNSEQFSKTVDYKEFTYAGILFSIMNNSTAKNFNINVEKDFIIKHKGNTTNTWNFGLGVIAGGVTGNSVIDNVGVNFGKDIKFGAMREASGGTGSWKQCSVGGVTGVVDGNTIISNTSVYMSSGSYLRSYQVGAAAPTLEKPKYPAAFIGGIVGIVSTANSINNIVFTAEDNTEFKVTTTGAGSGDNTLVSGTIIGRIYVSGKVSNVISNGKVKQKAEDGTAIGIGDAIGGGSTAITNMYGIDCDTAGTRINTDGTQVYFDRDNADNLVYKATSGKNIWSVGESKFYESAEQLTNQVSQAKPTGVISALSGISEVATGLSFTDGDVEYDGANHNGLTLTTPTGSVTSDIKNTTVGDVINVGDYSASIATGVGYIDETNRKVIFVNEELTANVAISKRNLEISFSQGDIYSANITINRLVGSDTATLTLGGESIQLADGMSSVFAKVGTYSLTLPSDSYYTFGEQTVDFSITAKTITVADGITLVGGNTDTVVLDNGTLTITERVDSIAMTATSTLYGIKYTAITGAVNANIDASNTVYTADVVINNEVTTLAIEKSLYTATATANGADGGTATVDISNPTIGSTVTFTATANEGYTFLGWTNGGKYVSTSLAYKVAVGADGLELTANFAQVEGSSVVTILGASKEEIGKFTTVATDIKEIINQANINYSYDDQAYNTFAGWAVASGSIEAGDLVLRPVYNESTVDVEVSVLGNVTMLKLNSLIRLEAGEYNINGVNTLVTENTRIFAIDKLIITAPQAESANSIDGFYDSEKNIVRVSIAIVEGFGSVPIKIYVQTVEGQMFEAVVKTTKVTNNFAQAIIDMSEIKGTIAGIAIEYNGLVLGRMEVAV